MVAALSHFFGLSPTRPHKRRPGHQMLADELPSWVWLRDRVPIGVQVR